MKYRIRLMESERGWGQEFWNEYYDTEQEARERIRIVNAKNTAEVAPDWYIAAFPDIVIVEDEEAANEV